MHNLAWILSHSISSKSLCDGTPEHLNVKSKCEIGRLNDTLHKLGNLSGDPVGICQRLLAILP